MGCASAVAAGAPHRRVAQLRKEKIVTMSGGHQYFKLVQQKTEGKVTIPILHPAKAVLERYGYNMPKPISNQKFRLINR